MDIPKEIQDTYAKPESEWTADDWRRVAVYCLEQMKVAQEAARVAQERSFLILEAVERTMSKRAVSGFGVRGRGIPKPKRRGPRSKNPPRDRILELVDSINRVRQAKDVKTSFRELGLRLARDIGIPAERVEEEAQVFADALQNAVGNERKKLRTEAAKQPPQGPAYQGLMDQSLPKKP